MSEKSKYAQCVENAEFGIAQARSLVSRNKMTEVEVIMSELAEAQVEATLALAEATMQLARNRRV